MPQYLECWISVAWPPTWLRLWPSDQCRSWFWGGIHFSSGLACSAMDLNWVPEIAACFSSAYLELLPLVSLFQQSCAEPHVYYIANICLVSGWGFTHPLAPLPYFCFLSLLTHLGLTPICESGPDSTCIHLELSFGSNLGLQKLQRHYTLQFPLILVSSGY